MIGSILQRGASCNKPPGSGDGGSPRQAFCIRGATPSRRVNAALLAALACLAASLPSTSRAEDGKGDNIVDAGFFDRSLVGHVVFYEVTLVNHVPVLVEDIDVTGLRLKWRDEKGHEGWRNATDFYSGRSVREREANTGALALGALVGCAVFGGCSGSTSAQAPH